MPRVLFHPKFRRLAGCALVAGATWGCASDESARRAVAELASVQRELAEMRTMHQGNTRELAELGSRMRGLESEAAGLATEIRSAAPELTRARAALEEADAALRARVTRSAPPAPAPAQAPGVASAARAAPATEPTPERLHASAMANVRAREPGQAVLELTDLIARFPRHPLAAAAQLGIGEAYYQQGDCRQALVELGKVVEGYPGSAQVPDALLKIGLCRRSLGEPGGATAAWRRLVSEHPRTDAAARARALLDVRSGAARRSR